MSWLIFITLKSEEYTHIGKVLEDELCRTLLLELIKSHLKLALEFGNPETKNERKEAIKAEIALIRSQQDNLIFNRL